MDNPFHPKQIGLLDKTPEDSRPVLLDPSKRNTMILKLRGSNFPVKDNKLQGYLQSLLANEYRKFLFVLSLQVARQILISRSSDSLVIAIKSLRVIMQAVEILLND